MDASLFWTATGTVVAGALGVVPLVTGWLERRRRRGGRLAAPTGGGALVTAGGTTPPWGRLPRAGVRGRGRIIRTLRRELRRRTGRVQVLAGLGGVGKSAVALELCAAARRRRRWRPRPVWWVSAADRASLTAGMIGVARQAGGRPEDIAAIARGAPEAPERLWALLGRARRGWLLVVDNADELAVLAATVPAGSTAGPGTVADGTGWIRSCRRGLVVVTSRIGDPQSWGPSQVDVHRIGVLDPDEATDVLLDLAAANRPGRTARRRVGRVGHVGRVGRVGPVQADERAAARDLAARLGGLPLALRLAGSVIGSDYSSWGSFREYREAFNAAGSALLTPDPDTPLAADPRAIVLRTWEVSLDALSAHGLPQARPLLRLLSCYAPAVPHPAGLLDDPRLGELLTAWGGPWDQADLVRARHGLARVGLIDVVNLPDGAGRAQSIVVHPLVADTNRAHLASTATSAAAATEIRRAAVNLLAKAAGTLDPTDPADWPTWRLLAPHLHALLEATAIHLSSDDLVALLDTAAEAVSFYIWTGAYHAGQQLTGVAIAQARPLPRDHPTVLNLFFRRAHINVGQGRWEEAEAGLVQVLDVQRQVLGAEHPRTLGTRHERARILGLLGHWQEAEAEFRAVLEARRRVLGPDHSRTLNTRHRLAAAIGELGRWDRAEPELRLVLDAQERLLGPEHPFTLFIRHDLGRAVGALGRWDEARTVFADVFDGRLRVLGPEHPFTLITRRDLARAVGELGRWDEAQDEFRRILDVQTRVLGAHHPFCQATRQQLEAAAARYLQVGESG